VVTGILLLPEVACVACFSKPGVELHCQRLAGNAATDDHDSSDLRHEYIQRVMN